MTTSIERVLRSWKSQPAIRLRQGLHRDKIAAICAKNEYELPSALRGLIGAVDGFDPAGDQDDRGFCFWPLERMERVDAFDGGAHSFPGSKCYLLFCDYLAWSWAYAVKIDGDPSGIGTVVMVGTSDGIPLTIAESFEGFLDTYVDDRPVLYGPTP